MSDDFDIADFDENDFECIIPVPAAVPVYVKLRSVIPDIAYCSNCQSFKKEYEIRRLMQFDGREVCNRCGNFVHRHLD